MAATSEVNVEVTAAAEVDAAEGDPRDDEVRAALSRGVEDADDDGGDEDVPRMEDMENFPGPVNFIEFVMRSEHSD